MTNKCVKQVLIILGMNHSSTFATSGIFARLGAKQPQNRSAAKVLNAEGLYESDAITAFNEELLSTLNIFHSDPNLTSRDWVNQVDASWYERAADIFNSEYADAELALLEGTQVGLLLPFWLRVLRQEKREPAIVFISTPPASVPGSLLALPNDTLMSRELLWLRYLLEAEVHSRGQRRAFIANQEILSDWQVTTARVAQELGITLDQSDSARTAVNNFLDDLELTEDAPDAALPEASTVFELFERWRTQGEDQSDYLVLDTQLHQLDAVNKQFLTQEKSSLELFHQTKYLEKSLAYYRSETNKTTALAEQLATARAKPLKVLSDLLQHRLLRKLSAQSSPLPNRMKARMLRSADKRDPGRSLQNWSPIAHQDISFVDYKGHVPRKPNVPNILIVSHDASWTGAPILAQNLGRVYKDRYNVTILSLRDGNLLPAFKDVAVHVEVMFGPNIESKYAQEKLKSFLELGNFAFAVVNSIESRNVLRMMRMMRLPTVALLHEFAAYTLPRTAFPEAIENADTTVFSTSVTLENAINVAGIAHNDKVRVLPQGKCEIPGKSNDTGPDEVERDRIKTLLKPRGDTPEILVIGAGQVQIRKGIDLFIEVARRTLSEPGGENFRFVWFGDGYRPNDDPSYSIYLQDQLERAGVMDRVQILPATPEIEYVYELADAFLLTSRLDPLPNVAIDAMLVGLPIVSFDKASGIPEILRAAGLHEECVADCFDTTQMASKLLRVTGPDRARISAAIQSHAELTFDFIVYAEKIESWAKGANEDHSKSGMNRPGSTGA